MKTKILSLLLILSSSLPAFARIGETEAQITARYGRVLNRDDLHGHRMLLYRKAGFQIGVVFYDGKSSAEIFSKIDKSELSADEIAAFLRANAAGGTWSQVGGVPLWKRVPDELIGIYARGTLTVSTPEFNADEKAIRERREKDAFKDF